MSKVEAPSSSSDDNPSIHQQFQSFRITGGLFQGQAQYLQPKPLGKDHNAASCSSATTTNNDDDNWGALALPNVILQDLNSAKADLAEAKEYMDYVNVQVNLAVNKLEELQTGGGAEADLHQLRKHVAMLKSQIPSHLKIQPTAESTANSDRHGNRRPDANKASDEMMHNLYKEQKFEHTVRSEGLLKAFYDLHLVLQYCLLCFFRFPPTAIVKRTVMIYLWIGEGIPEWLIMGKKIKKDFVSEEDVGNKILDELIAKGFVDTVDQKQNLVPNSCRMSLAVRSALTTIAEGYEYLSNYTFGPNTGCFGIGPHGSCLINVDETTIRGGPELFEKMKDIKVLYLGKWQSSTTHHIVMQDTKILYGLKNINDLRFLSLRGISWIVELPPIISQLTSMKILDLSDCNNLEVVPKGIGLLSLLTHLDFSKCYLLDYMPKSLSKLLSLEVLKGFFIGDLGYDKRSCTLDKLSRLQWLRKLSIYTTVKNFPTEGHLRALQQFRALRKLKICWGACRSVDGNNTTLLKRGFTFRADKPPPELPSTLHKLHIECCLEKSPPSWLRPANLKELKKLYITGGQLCDLGKFQIINNKDQWTVETLRLKYLSKLKMDWKELKKLFPKLIYLQKVECPELTNFPCGGEWYVDEQAKEEQAVVRKGITNLEGLFS